MEIVYTCPGTKISRTFSWCGQTWSVKHSPREKVGPGPSTFHFKNVELGTDRSLRLWVRDVTGNDNKKCCSNLPEFSSAEIRTVAPLGYGLYKVDVHGPLTGSRWKHLVFGFFTYDLDNSSQNNKEIDIEIGTFNGKHSSGGVFSNQNNKQGEKQLMDIHPSINSFKHRLSINWTPTSISWSLMNIENDAVLDFLTTTSRVPSSEGACFMMNLWQFRNVIPDGKEQCIILKDFKHIPYEIS